MARTARITLTNVLPAPARTAPNATMASTVTPAVANRDGLVFYVTLISTSALRAPAAMAERVSTVSTALRANVFLGTPAPFVRPTSTSANPVLVNSGAPAPTSSMATAACARPASSGIAARPISPSAAQAPA